MKDQSTQKMIKARASLILDRPFYGALALKLSLKFDPGSGTAWTDGKTLGFDPAYINSISLEEVKGLWEEETLHCFLQHHTRRGDRDPQDWNAAADQAIFHILDQAGSALPADCQPRREFKDMNAEQIYTAMGRGKEKSPQAGPQPGQQQQQQPGQGQTPGAPAPGQQQPGPGRQPGAGQLGEVRDATDRTPAPLRPGTACRGGKQLENSRTTGRTTSGHVW